MCFCTLLTKDMAQNGRTKSEVNFSPAQLYTSDKSPVQYGFIYEIKRYLKKKNPPDLKKHFADLAEYAKKKNLGTHKGVSYKKEGEYNYSIYPHKDEFFECNLMDVYGKHGKSVLKINEGSVFALIVINIQTKMVYFRLLQTRGGKEVAEALKYIFEIDIQPKLDGFLEILLHCDHGKEFNNVHVSSTMKLLHIHLCSSQSDHEAAVVERVIRTICALLVRAMEI